MDTISLIAIDDTPQRMCEWCGNIISLMPYVADRRNFCDKSFASFVSPSESDRLNFCDIGCASLYSQTRCRLCNLPKDYSTNVKHGDVSYIAEALYTNTYTTLFEMLPCVDTSNITPLESKKKFIEYFI